MKERVARLGLGSLSVPLVYLLIGVFVVNENGFESEPNYA